MTRTVKVELEADVAGFLGGVLEAERATGKLDDKVEALDHDLNKLGRDAVETGAEVGVLGGAAKETSGEVYEFGKRTEETGKKTAAAGDDTKAMRARIDELKDSLKATGAEMARNSDPELFKKFKSDSSELKGLESMVGKMEKLGVDVKQLGLEAEKAGPGLSALFEGGLTSPASLGAIGAVAPVVLGAAGGLTGALAGGGVAAAGVAGAVAGNPQAFKAEWGSAIGDIKKDWIDASQPFVGPTLAAIRSIGPMVASWHIDEMFAKASTYVAPLVSGVEGLTTGIERGVASLVDKAGPEIAVISADMSRLGDGIDTSLSLISDNATGGAEALHALDSAVIDLVVGFGAIVSAGEAVSQGITDASNSVKGFFDGIPGWVSVAIPPLGLWKAAFDATTPDTLQASEKGLANVLPNTNLALQAQAADLSALSQKLNAADQTMDKFVGTQVSKALSTILSLDQATLGFDDSLLHLGDAFKSNGLAIDKHTGQISMNTEKGIANQQAILGVVSANIQEYKANIDAGMSAEQAAGAYDSNTAALERQLRKSGLTAAQIDKLIGKYKNVPDKVDTDIVLHGLETAIQNLNETLRLINNIHDKNATVSVTTVYHTKGSPNVGEGGTQLVHPGSANRYGGIRRAAEGMLVPPSDPGTVLFGEPETGGEAFIPLRGISPDRAMSLARVVGDNYGFDVTPRGRGMMSTGWHGSSASSGPTAVTLDMAAGADLTPLGSLLNKMLRDGIIVVKASQVRQNS